MRRETISNTVRRIVSDLDESDLPIQFRELIRSTRGEGRDKNDVLFPLSIFHKYMLLMWPNESVHLDRC